MYAGGDVPRHLTHSFLDLLADDDRCSLMQAGQTRRWKRGEVLVRAGDPVDSAIVILSGLVNIHKNADATEGVLALCGPSDILGEISAVRDASRSASVTALEPVEGVIISVPALRHFLADHPRSAFALLDLARAPSRHVRRPAHEFASSGSLGRVNSRLVELAERSGVAGSSGQLVVAVPITQEELHA